MPEEWMQAWQPTIDAIGQDFGGGVERTAIDVIELGAVRKFLEAVELDCPLHYDAEAARAHG